MNIYINGRFLTQRITGVQRYAIEVIRIIDNLISKDMIDKKKYNFILLAPQSADRAFSLENIQINYIGTFNGHAWEQFQLPFYIRGGLLLNLCGTGPLIIKNQIVTIHDAAVFANKDNFSLKFKLWFQFLTKGLAKASKKVMTVSHFSKSELKKYCKVDEKVIVAHLGHEHIKRVNLDEQIVDKFNLRKNNYILAVSSLSPNKNFASILRAIELLGQTNFDIVIAGGTNPKIFNKTTLMKNENSKVKFVGYISDNELRTLYENAGCFIYPSIYEGFGIPPIEAMACGCPVIVSNRASLPEVCGDAALYCNPDDPNDIAEKISEIMNNHSLRDLLKSKGIEHSKKFSWSKCTDTILEVIYRS